MDILCGGFFHNGSWIKFKLCGLIRQSNMSNPFTEEIEFGIYSNVEQCPVLMDGNLEFAKIL